jgi:hypothetical protein
LCPAGWSPFPGNINQLVLKLSSYVPQLAATGGNISEFVNPKYKDASKTAFKSSTRLECMMQDYPKALPADAKVGFTVVNQVRYMNLWVLLGCVYISLGYLLQDYPKFFHSFVPSWAGGSVTTQYHRL